MNYIEKNIFEIIKSIEPKLNTKYKGSVVNSNVEHISCMFNKCEDLLTFLNKRLTSLKKVDQTQNILKEIETLKSNITFYKSRIDHYNNTISVFIKNENIENDALLNNIASKYITIKTVK